MITSASHFISSYMKTYGQDSLHLIRSNIRIAETRELRNILIEKTQLDR